MDPSSIPALIVAGAVALPGLIAAIGTSGRKSRRSERLHRSRCADWEVRHFETQKAVLRHNYTEHAGDEDGEMPLPPTPTYLNLTEEDDAE